MPIPRHARRRPGRALAIVFTGLLALSAACSTAVPGPSGSSRTSPTVSVGPTLAPTPTPVPTPRYTNEPDPALSALIPSTIAGATVHKPAATDFAVTPGDFGSVFGDIGLRFTSLVLAYVEKPRLSLYAARVMGDPVQTADLRPYLVQAGVYVGASDRRPELWKSAVVGGHQVWMRPGDEASLPGTTFYCWSSGTYVFLLVGSSDAANRAMVTALPGQPVPTPTPRPTGTPAGSGSARPSAASSAVPSASSVATAAPSS